MWFQLNLEERWGKENVMIRCLVYGLGGVK